MPTLPASNDWCRSLLCTTRAPLCYLIAKDKKPQNLIRNSLFPLVLTEPRSRRSRPTRALASALFLVAAAAQNEADEAATTTRMRIQILPEAGESSETAQVLLNRLKDRIRLAGRCHSMQLEKLCRNPINVSPHPSTTKLPARVGSSLLLGPLTIPEGRPAASWDTSLEPNTSPQSAAAIAGQSTQVCGRFLLLSAIWGQAHMWHMP